MKDQTKILKFNVVSLELGVSNDGNEPSSYTNLGFLHEESLKLKLEAVFDKEAGGQSIQKGWDTSYEVGLQQVLDAATVESTFMGKNIWAKATSDKAQIIKIKNFLAVLAPDLNISLKGKSSLVLKGTKFATALSDVYSIS